VRDFLLLEEGARDRVFARSSSRRSRRFGPLAAAESPSRRGGSDGSREIRATERILSNLLDNAVKFSPERDRGRAGDAGMVEVLVENQGIGIPLAEQERVFEPFARLDREKPGAGLGLSIARELAEAQGGRLSLTSEPGRGSTFVLTLPRA
jgi:signal transduction histidine kinase